MLGNSRCIILNLYAIIWGLNLIVRLVDMVKSYTGHLFSTIKPPFATNILVFKNQPQGTML